MTIKEIAILITTKDYLFQVSIPETKFNHGKTSVSMALADSESVETYLTKIATTNKANHLYVKLFTKNGSSFKARGEHLIFLTTPQPVATATTSVATTQPALKGITEHTTETPTKQKTSTMDNKDYIDFKVLQSEHKRLEQTHEESKSKIVKLEKKVEELHDENKQLLRENLTKEDKHALALERTKLDLEKEGKDGLSGMIGELTKDPDTLKMIIGFLKPDHPMFKENNQAALEGAVATEIKYTEDSDVNMVLNDIPRSLSQKDGKTIGEMYLLFKELINDPGKLETAIKTFLPQQ
jgi:hypothetical protein